MSAAEEKVRLASAEAWLCRVPMPRPVVLGSIVYPTRDYVVARVQREDGTVGSGIGYTRGTPLLEAFGTVAAAAADFDLREPAAVHDDLARMFMPGWSQLVRGASLLDIALWDAAATAAGQPLHRLLGADDDRAPLMAVVGYFADARDDDSIVREAVAAAEAGMVAVKLLLSGYDPARDRAIAEGVAAALPDGCRMGIDFHAPWRNATEAADYCAPLVALEPFFVEDPFPASERRLFSELAPRLGAPLAAGEDVPGLSGYVDLLDAVGVLRVDATASGGITTAVRAIEAAGVAGVRVLPHVFPFVHAPLAAAFPAVGNVEVIMPDVGADPVDRLLSEPFPIDDRGGWCLDPLVPGLHLPIDWEAVERLSTASFAWRR